MNLATSAFRISQRFYSWLTTPSTTEAANEYLGRRSQFYRRREKSYGWMASWKWPKTLRLRVLQRKQDKTISDLKLSSVAASLIERPAKLARPGAESCRLEASLPARDRRDQPGRGDYTSGGSAGPIKCKRLASTRRLCGRAGHVTVRSGELTKRARLCCRTWERRGPVPTACAHFISV